MPKVSVIIPSYNHEQFVGEAIQSVLDQTFTDFEIVVVDDFSQDKTVAEIKKFKDPRVRLFTFKKNKGACTAANFAVSKAKGTYVAMLSSDDVFEPTKLEKQVAYLNANPKIGAVFTKAKIIDQFGKHFAEKHFYSVIFDQPNRTQAEWLRYFFYNANCLCHPSALIRKKVYSTIGGYDPRFAQLPDLHFWIRLCKKFPIHIISEQLLKFRIHTSNVSGDTTKTHARHQVEMLWILKEFLTIEPEMMKQIFPEMNHTKMSSLFTPYCLAHQAVQLASPAHQLFGLSTFCDLLAKKPGLLKDLYQFDYVDFNNLTAQNNVFNIASKEKEQLRSLIAKSNYLEYETASMRNSLFYTMWKIWHRISK